MTRPLLELLPDIRHWACSAQGVLVLGSRASHVVRAIDAAFLAQRAWNLLKRIPIVRGPMGNMKCIGCGSVSNLEKNEPCESDCWVYELEGLVEELREACR